MTVQLPPMRLLNDPLEYWAAQTPDDEALSYAGRHWTWAQWRDRVRRATGMIAVHRFRAATGTTAVRPAPIRVEIATIVDDDKGSLPTQNG